ncbi:hypothetical protein Pyn_20164 [Prunus yedoensis var. nudiflora]|uniref:Uncharacterized protein n=1 Tax=Prunus yedoensis var. nudiflora TaxID=2094558 RepID=A0A314YQA6_PRUYE|nr:hypothetical protein Pyn_20164 [Prunus yedoensis var. nudiflora]
MGHASFIAFDLPLPTVLDFAYISDDFQGGLKGNEVELDLVQWKFQTLGSTRYNFYFATKIPGVFELLLQIELSGSEIQTAAFRILKFIKQKIRDHPTSVLN